MTIKEFAELVNKMRRAQDSYFSTRSTEALSEARKLEALVDRAIREIGDNQGKLF